MIINLLSVQKICKNSKDSTKSNEFYCVAFQPVTKRSCVTFDDTKLWPGILTARACVNPDCHWLAHGVEYCVNLTGC